MVLMVYILNGVPIASLTRLRSCTYSLFSRLCRISDDRFHVRSWPEITFVTVKGAGLVLFHAELKYADFVCNLVRHKLNDTQDMNGILFIDSRCLEIINSIFSECV